MEEFIGISTADYHWHTNQLLREERVKIFEAFNGEFVNWLRNELQNHITRDPSNIIISYLFQQRKNRKSEEKKVASESSSTVLSPVTF